MSTPDTGLPFPPAAAIQPSGPPPGLKSVPGLSPEAIAELEASFPGILTEEMRSLLHATCGFAADPLGALDFTSRWHPAEPISVFRPCLTFAIDDEGCRWIAETSRDRGLPGPVWCVLPDPAVAVCVSDDLGAFLEALHADATGRRRSEWIRDVYAQARLVWASRHSLARAPYQISRDDRGLRGWLAELPLGARVFDLRKPSALRGWPYGLAGPDGELYRCARLPVFAVSASAQTSRWMQHMAHIAASGEILSPAVARLTRVA
jgi:hypothetical protein